MAQGSLTAGDFDPEPAATPGRGALTAADFDPPKGALKADDFDAPVPAARDQYVKAAGQLIAHATLVAQNAASDLLDPVGRAATEVSEKYGLKADLPEMDAARKKAGYDTPLAAIALNPVEHSQAVVDRLTKAAHEAAIQFGIKPSDEEVTQNPTMAALGPGPMKAMRAFQALIDTALPEVQALGQWAALKEKPLTDRLDALINRSKKQSALEDAAIAPVETTTKDVPKFDLATRAAFETGSQLVYGAAETARAMLNPVTAVEAELGAAALGVVASGAGRLAADAASRVHPEAALRAELSPVSKLTEASTARLAKDPADWTPMDHVHQHVHNQTNAALDGVQERTGAGPEAMRAAADAADRAGYADVYRRLHDLPSWGIPVNARTPFARLTGPAAAEGGAGAPARPVPTTPADVAAQTIGAGALGPDAAAVARQYPSLYAAATGAQVPQAAAADLAAALDDLQARGLPPGPILDMVKAGVATGQASLVQLAKADEALQEAALAEAGAHPQTLARHAADAYAAAQRPGETLVAHAMEVQAQKAAVLARATATQEVWDEAHRELAANAAARAPQAHGRAPEQQVWERHPQREGETSDQYQQRLERKLREGTESSEAAPLPGRAEALAHAEEAGVPVEQAAEMHRAEALQAQEAGTLDPAVAQEYADQGDDSFDPAALEEASRPFPNLAKDPAEMTWAEFQAEYPGMEKDTHQAIIDEAHYAAETARREDAAEAFHNAGLTAQPAHDEIRKNPIGEKWIQDLGLTGEFASLKGRGLTVRGGTDENRVDAAVTRLQELGLLPEGASVNDLLDALDHEARKGSKASATASMVRDGSAFAPGPEVGGPSPRPTTAGTPGSPPVPESLPKAISSYPKSITDHVQDFKALFGEAPLKGMAETLRQELTAADEMGKPPAQVVADRLKLLDATTNALVEGLPQVLKASAAARRFVADSLARDAARRVLLQGEAPSAAVRKAHDAIVSSLQDAGAADEEKAPVGVGASVVRENIFAPTFYSKLQADVAAKMGPSATVEQVRALLRDQKQEEVEWSGVEDFLAGKEKVAKAEMQEFLRANQLEVQEVTLGESSIAKKDETGDYQINPDRFTPHQKEAEETLTRAGVELTVDPANGARVAFLSEDGEVMDRRELADFYGSKEGGEILKDKGVKPSDLFEAADAFGEESGNTRYGEYQLPGGENYRELLLTMPTKDEFDPSKVEIIRNRQSVTQGTVSIKYNGKNLGTWGDEGTVENKWMRPDSELTEIARRLWEKGDARNKVEPASGQFHSSHFDEPNILAHVRFNDRVDAEGKRVLFLEEVQSDWHQKGRRKGYRSDIKAENLTARRLEPSFQTEAKDRYEIIDKKTGASLLVQRGDSPEQAITRAVEGGMLERAGVPDAPLKKTWHEFALKRMIRYAAENGYDKIAWTTGEQQAERYDLSKQVDAVNALRYDDGTYSIRAKPVGSRHWNVVSQKASDAELAGLVGKDLAQKITAQAKGDIEYSGLSLKVGGEGMKGFYDKIVPSFLNKFGKKFGAQVGSERIDIGEQDAHQSATELLKEQAARSTVHSLPITPALREAALHEGFTLFDRDDSNAKAYGPDADVRAIAEGVQLDLDFGAKDGAAAKFAKDGKVDYRGLDIRDIHDVAEVVASRRHPQLEHHNYVLARAGKVVAHLVYTSGLPNAVLITPDDLLEVAAAIDAHGADEVWTGHNHPSGDPDPSYEDKVFSTKLQDRFGDKYKGMIVTDGDEFNHISHEKVGARKYLPRVTANKFAAAKENFVAGRGPQVLDRLAVVAQATKDANMGKAHVVLLLDARARVMALENYPLDADVAARLRADIVRHKASSAVLVAPKRATVSQRGLPFELRDVVHVDENGQVVPGYFSRPSEENSAYGTMSSTRVAEPAPRYMGGQGMDAEDFARAVAEAKIISGSPVTSRVKFEGLPKGTPGKVLAVGQTTQTLMVQFEGETVPRAVRAENLVETNRKPAARAAVEAARKAAKVSGQPSLSVKRIIQDGQAGLAATTPVQMDELQALAEKFKNMNKGARLGAREATKALREKMDAKIDEYQKKVGDLKDAVKFSKAEATANADWLRAEQDAIRGEIVDYINGALPVEARGKFLATVKNADTVAKMLYARQAVDDAVGLLHKKGLLADVRKLVPRILDSPGVDVKAKQAVREYLQDVEVKGRSAATYARLRATLDYMVGQEAAGVDVALPKAVVEELDVLGRRPLKDMSEAEVEGIYNRLKMLEEIGRTTVKARESLYLLERARISEEILADLKPIEARSMTPQAGYKPLGHAAAAANAVKAALNWAYGKNLDLTPPDVVWDMLSKTPQYGGAPIKYFAHRIGSDYARALDGYDGPIRAGRDLIDKNKITDEDLAMTTAHAYVAQPGGEAYLRNRLGLTDADIAQVKTLEPRLEELYQHWRKSLDAVYPQLADTVRFNDNQEVGRVPHYFPVRFDPSRALDVGEDLAGMIRGLHNGFQKNVQMGNLKKRQGSDKAVALDGRVTFENYMRLAHYKIAMSRDVRLLGEVVNSPEFAEGAGEFGTRFAKQFITLLARRGAPRVGDVIPRLDNARRAGSVFAIVGRLPTALVHMTLLSNAAAISGPGPIFGAFKDVLAQSRDQDPALETWWRKNDPGYRQAHGDDPVFQDAVDVAHWGSKEWWKALTTPTSLRYIVRKATLATLEGNYRQALAKRGLARDLAAPVHPDALNEARLLTRRAIPSTDLPHMFLAYNSGDVLTGNLSLNRVATQFKNFTIDRWSAYSHDLPAMVKRGNYADAASFVFWQTASDFVEVGIRHGYKWALAAALGAGAAEEMDEDHRKLQLELFMKILEKPPFVPDILNALLYGRVPTATASLAYDGLIAKPHDMVRAHALGQRRKFYQSITEDLIDLAALAGFPMPFGGTFEQVMRMVLADGGVRFPYADDRTRLNNFYKDGTALPEDIQRRALLNHVYARFEKLNANYKSAMKDGRTGDAAQILEAMKNLARVAKP